MDRQVETVDHVCHGPDGRTVEAVGTVDPPTPPPPGRPRPPLARSSRGAERNSVAAGDRLSLEGHAGEIPPLPDLPSEVSRLDRGWHGREDPACSGRGSRTPRRD